MPDNQLDAGKAWCERGLRTTIRGLHATIRGLHAAIRGLRAAIRGLHATVGEWYTTNQASNTRGLHYLCENLLNGDLGTLLEPDLANSQHLPATVVGVAGGCHSSSMVSLGTSRAALHKQPPGAIHGVSFTHSGRSRISSMVATNVACS